MQNSVHVIGHRGAAGVLPENTLKGFRYALELGADAVECDVHRTRDGGVVVIHDEKVDRTTDGSGRVADMDLAAIGELDAGDGERVPTLAELLAVVRGSVLLCELKADGVEAPAVDAVLAGGMEKDVIFVSFSMQRLANVKGRGEKLRIGAILGSPRPRDIRRAAEMGAVYVGVNHKRISLEAVEEIRKAGMAVGAWTVNELAEVKAMLALGVGRITTDRPDILLEYLRKG